MTQIDSLKRRNLVLGLIAVLLLAYGIFRPSATSAVTSESLPRLFPDLKLADARTVLIEREGADADAPAVRIQRAGETGWVLTSSHGYPASVDKVNKLLEDLQGTRRKKFITERAETFGEYAEPDGWMHVKVLGEGGATLADLHVGKSAGWPDSFVRVQEGGKAAVVRAHNLSGSELRLTPESWSVARLWPGLTLPDVGRVVVYQDGADADLIFEREVRPVAPVEGEPEESASTESVWVMRTPQTVDPEKFKVEGLVRTFNGMRFAKIAARSAGAAEDEHFGFAKPALRVAVFAAPEGDKAPKRLGALLVGKEVPSETEGAPSDRYYVRREGDEWVFEVTAASVADFRQAPDDYLPPPPEPVEPETPAGDTSGSPDGEDDPDAPPLGDLPPLPPVEPDEPETPKDD